MPTPSLLIVPARFKSGKLYSQLPTSGAGDFTVTRATAATRVNASGFIESVASGIPRLDYFASGGTIGCPALLVEPSAQNICLQSENFSTTWFTTNTVVSGNVAGTTDPAGGNTADQIFETVTSGNHFLAQTMTIVSGTTYVGSVFYKKAAGSPDWMQVAFSTTGLAGFANFNLTSGTVGLTGAGCTGRIENYGNGWYRCILIQTATANGTSGGPIIVFTNNTNSVTRFVSYAGNTATSIYAWGAQLETGSVATSYIPTTTAAVTRNADVISVSGAVSGSIGQTEGTIYAEVDFRNLGYNGVIATIQTNDWFADSIQIQKSLGNQWRFTIRAASTNIMNIDVGTITAGIYRVALAYNTATSGTVLAVNGSILSTQTASSIPACNSLVLGARNQNGTFIIHLNDRIRAAALYTTRLTNVELQSLTTL